MSSRVTLSDGRILPTDFVATSGGWSPSLHLYCHAKGRPEWDEIAGAFRAGNKLPGVEVVGAAAGTWDFDALLQQAAHAVGGTDAPRSRGKVRHFLGKRIRLRYTPELDFKYDEAPERGGRIESLLAEINRTKQENDSDKDDDDNDES